MVRGRPNNITATMRFATAGRICQRSDLVPSHSVAVAAAATALSVQHCRRSLCQVPSLIIAGGSSTSEFFHRHNPTIQTNPVGSILNTRTIHQDAKLSSDEKQIVFTALDGENCGVAKLTFNRPNAANAMGRTMLSQLQSQIAYLSNHKTEVRCVVLTSATSKVFSAGADLRERSKMTQEEAAEFVSSLRSTFDAMAHLPMPVISAIEGVAVGGGLEIALTSDIIVAGENAKFGLPETSLAIIPGAGGTQRLPRLIGVARAKELIFTARRIDAQTAHEYGLVQHVVSAGDAQGKALEIARDIAANGPLAIRAAKSSVLQGIDAPNLVDAMEIERKFYQTIIPTEDRLEGLAAFREKRRPEYKGE